MKEFKFNDIGFVGTYECNKDCSYCFSEKYIKPFKGKELSFERFKEIVDILKHNGTDSIMFLGGEPGLWKYINEAIDYSKSIGIKTTVFTNATVKIKAIPDVFYIHLNILFMFKDKSFLENIYEYSKKSKIIFIYNIFEPSIYKEKLVTSIFKSFKFDFAVSIGLIFGKKLDKSYGDLFYRMTRFLTNDLGKIVYSSGPVPLCVFDKKQEFYLRAKIGMSGTCGTPSLIKTDAFTVVNPDGKTILPCAPLHISKDIKYLLNNDIGKYIKAFSEHTKKLRNRKPSLCDGCELYKTKCQAGCLVGQYSEDEKYKLI